MIDRRSARNTSPSRPGAARTRSIALLVTGLASAGCSFMKLDEFTIPSCNDDVDCQPVDRVHPEGVDACHVHQCRAGRCVLGALDHDNDQETTVACGGHDCDDTRNDVHGGTMPASETCDGRDNDCNGVIDEQGAVAGPIQTLSNNISTPSGAVVSIGSRTAVALLAADETASFVIDDGAMTTAPRALGFTRQVVDDSLTMPTLVTADTRCPVGTAAGVGSTPCTFTQVALANDGMRWMTATVNTTGCTRGQLRLGYFEESEGLVVQRGPNVRSTVYLGVEPAMSCTTAIGATRPSIAVIRPPTGPTQAFVAWLAADASTYDTCRGGGADVRAVMAWLETGSAGGQTISWVSASDPVTIGHASGGAPVVTTWPEYGFVVAYPDASGVSIAAWHYLDAPPPVAATAMSTDSRTMPSLGAPAAMASIALPATGGLALGLGTVSSTRADVLVAGTTGACATSGSAVGVSRVVIDANTHAATASAPSMIPDSTALGSPVIAFAPQGFVTTSFARGGMQAAADTTGGWAVIWPSSDGPRVSRVLALDGMPVDTASRPLVAGGSRVIGMGASSAADPRQVSTILVDATAGAPAIERLDLFCRAEGR